MTHDLTPQQEATARKGLPLHTLMLGGFVLGLVAGLLVYALPGEPAWVEPFTWRPPSG